MGYKILGFVVWKAAKWFVRRRVGRMMPSRRVASMALAGSAVAATIAVVAAKRNGSSE